MAVEIQLVGSPKRWQLEGPAIRIGRSPDCEVELPAASFPEVSREHALLRVQGNELRIVDRQSGNGTFVNGQRIQETALAAGDTVRLGPQGPELLVRVMAAAATAADAGQTVRAPGAGMADEGRTLRVPAAAPGRAAPPPKPPVAAERPAKTEPPPGAEAIHSPRVADAAMETLERELGQLRLRANLALGLALVLVAMLVYVAQQLTDTRGDLARMRAEAATVASQAAPTLQADQGKLEGMDSRIAAQERAAEDHFVERMNQELPGMIDKYMDAKAKELGIPKPGGH